ncbi:hypothetical protein [Bifidobacterium sp.]|jgi:hypothetical protein|uniref:hypothetical protein n=1 Tax=Bifidobacterium sp. TaxID=41200 RepID=UPI0025C39A9B|nr:hypothetical protein [Bifidobacterium sp.]MCH4208768.1 hypothetical protein [Bifidobacterium sp.]MCI1224028.1 hypothetical protein [Bifidobacterium sp.]
MTSLRDLNDVMAIQYTGKNHTTQNAIAATDVPSLRTVLPIERRGLIAAVCASAAAPTLGGDADMVKGGWHHQRPAQPIFDPYVAASMI